MTRDRLEAFSDGVFAIVITLLFIDIHLPDNADPSIAMLRGLVPSVGVFILTFWIVGTYWVAHHTILNFVATVDRSLLYLNLFLLLGIVITPLPAKMLAEHPTNLIALGAYAIVLSFINLIGVAIWLRVTASSTTPESRRVRRNIALIHSSPIAIYAIGFLFGIINPWISLGFYVIVPIFFTLPNPWIEDLVQKAKQLLVP